MDYISNFFSVVDCYLAIESRSLCALTRRSNDVIDRSFNGKSYLQMLLDFVNESLFDPELGYQEQSYAVGVLMIIVHYLYRTSLCLHSQTAKVDTVIQPAVDVVNRYIAAKEADITRILNDNEEEEDIKQFYLEQARDCIVSAGGGCDP